MINLKKMLFIIILIFSYNLNSQEKIIFEIDNKIYTSIDLEDRVYYLNIIKSNLKKEKEIYDDFLSVIIYSIYGQERKIQIKNDELNSYLDLIEISEHDIKNIIKIKKNLFYDINRKKILEKILHKEEIDLNKKINNNNLYNYLIKIITINKNELKEINFDNNFNDIKKNLDNKKYKYKYIKKKINNIDKLNQKFKQKILNNIFEFQYTNNQFINLIKIEVEIKKNLDPALSFYRIRNLENENLEIVTCENLDYLYKQKNIEITDYKNIKYSSINEKIKNKLKKINDYIILNINDYILLCNIQIDNEKLKNSIKIDLISNKINVLDNNIITKYKYKYNYKKYE